MVAGVGGRTATAAEPEIPPTVAVTVVVTVEVTDATAVKEPVLLSVPAAALLVVHVTVRLAPGSASMLATNC
jgi:hypothetical protein